MVNPTRGLCRDCIQKCKTIFRNRIYSLFQVTYACTVGVDIACNALENSRSDSSSWSGVSGSARFLLMVKGTPGAGKWSRTYDVDAEAADWRSRRPTGEPERR
jgi:hypothetical protein